MLYDKARGEDNPVTSGMMWLQNFQFDKVAGSNLMKSSNTTVSGDLSIGVLHSLTGTMASSERPLVDAATMAVEEINSLGGVLKRQIRPVIADEASEPETFARQAKRLLNEDRVATLFGCWTSASRKAVLPELEATDSLLWYPVQYEGLEENRHVIYSGSCLNQQIVPAVRWALAQGWRSCLLVGSDYVFPRTANLMIASMVRSNGGEVLGDDYIRLGSQNFAELIDQIRALRPDVIFNTLNGDSNLGFFRQLREAGFDATALPVVSFSVSEDLQQQLASEGTGHYTCWSYFQSLKTVENLAFLDRFWSCYGKDRVTSDAIVAAYNQAHLWRLAVEAAGNTDTSDILGQLNNIHFLAPSGDIQVMPNHHLCKEAMIGRARPDGQFDIVWRSDGAIDPKPWLGIEDLELESRGLVLETMRQFSETIHYANMLETEIGRRRAAEIELKQAQNIAETANRAKSIFLANMSHELRTPLNAILGFTRLMAKDPEATATQRESLRIINRSGEYLLEMINEILDLAKIESGRMQLEPVPIDLTELLLDISDMIKNRAEAKGLSFRLEIEPAMTRYVSVDSGKLRQILINLLGNAVKFTDQGNITFRATSRPLPEESGRCLLGVEVADTGRGIEPSMQQRIFEPFVQDGMSIAGQQGTGLGLTITRNFIQMMGGTIDLQSSPGIGSVFRLQMPLRTVEADEVTCHEKEERMVIGLAPGEASRKILVAEDNEDNRKLLSGLLAGVGFDVLEAENGLDAVEKFEHQHPDMIMMDIRMPVMDGYQAIERIRQMPGGDRVKIAAITASVFKHERDKLLASDFDAVHLKPYREGDIFRTMAELLNLRYRYADENQAPSVEISGASAETLSQLDPLLLEPIKAAALRGSGKNLKLALAPLAEQNPRVAAALTAMADAYRFDEIVDLIERSQQREERQ